MLRGRLDGLTEVDQMLKAGVFGESFFDIFNGLEMF